MWMFCQPHTTLSVPVLCCVKNCIILEYVLTWFACSRHGSFDMVIHTQQMVLSVKQTWVSNSTLWHEYVTQYWVQQIVYQYDWYITWNILSYATDKIYGFLHLQQVITRSPLRKSGLCSSWSTSATGLLLQTDKEIAFCGSWSAAALISADNFIYSDLINTFAWN